MSQGSLELRNTHTSCLTNCGHTRILWSTSRHGCYLRCDGPFSFLFPGQCRQHRNVHRSTKTKGKRAVSVPALSQPSNMCCLLSGSTHNTILLCANVSASAECSMCVGVGAVNRIYMLLRALHVIHTHLHLTTLGQLCLFTSECASSAVLVEWVWVSEKEKSNTGFTKDLEQAAVF